MKKKGQAVGAQVIVLVVFSVALVLVFIAFLHPTNTLDLIDNAIEKISNFEWRSLEVKILFSIILLSALVSAIFISLTKVFEEREV